MPVEPAGRDGLGLGVADGAGEEDLGRRDGLLEVVGRQTDAAFGQEQTRIAAHLAVQPGVGIGQRGPCAFVKPAEDDEVRALHPRLDRAPDHDEGMRRDRVAHLGAVKDALKERRVVAERQVGPVDRLAQELVHHLARLASRRLVPEAAASLPAGAVARRRAVSRWRATRSASGATGAVGSAASAANSQSSQGARSARLSGPGLQRARSGKGGPLRRMWSSRSRVCRRWRPRSSPLPWVSGCLRRTRRASAVSAGP
jgi:hypothetical protein